MMPRPALLLLLLFAVVPGARGADWPHWRGPHHTGHSDETGFVQQWEAGGEPEIVWTAEVGTGFSSFAVVGNRVYTLGNRDEKDQVVCLDQEPGDVVWTQEYAAPLDPNLFEGGPTSTPTVLEGRVFTLSRRGELHCHDAASGEPQWRTDLPATCEVSIPTWGFSSSPIPIEGNLLINAGSRGVAVNPEDGSIVWQSDNREDAGYASPVPLISGGRRLAVVVSAKTLNAVDAKTGEVVWSFRWITRYGVNAADPYVVGERVLVSSGYAKGSSLLVPQAGDEPEELWRTRELRNQMSPGVVIDGALYAVDGDAGRETALKCLEIDSGTVVWNESGLGSATLVAADGHLLVLSEQGELLIAPATVDGFDPRGRVKILEGKCWTTPVLSGGRLYARNASGTVVCVNLQSRD